MAEGGEALLGEAPRSAGSVASADEAPAGPKPRREVMYETFMREAGAAGDLEAVKVARRAVAGSKRAQTVVRRMILEAAAQAD